MLKALSGEIRPLRNCDHEGIVYKTYIPIHTLDCSLYELNSEIKENKVGQMEFVTERGRWKDPIINLDITYDASYQHLWTECGGKFANAEKDYTDIVSVVIAGYWENKSNYYSDRSTSVRFFAIPVNEDTAEGKQTKLGLEIFEKYPEYYEITKRTKQSFVFRYRDVLDEFPMSLESRPMLLPLQYLQQEFCMNAYIGEEVIGEEHTYEARLPVVRFWEEIDGELQPQFYTYEYKELYKNQHRKPIDRMVEVTLKKVNPKTVKHGDGWFYVTKKFHF